MLEKTIVKIAKPVATTTKRAIGMYAEGIGMAIGRARRAQSLEKPSGLYHTRTRSRNFPQLTEIKQVCAVLSLTLPKTGTYTDSNDSAAHFRDLRVRAPRVRDRGRLPAPRRRAGDPEISVRQRRQRRRRARARPRDDRFHRQGRQHGARSAES